MILGKFERVIHISYKLSTVFGQLSTGWSFKPGKVGKKEAWTPKFDFRKYQKF
jgi:hypothetical protein